MATTLTSNTPPLRDVLYAFSLAKPMPDAEVLDDFVRRYPEYAAALTDFAIELVMDTLTGALYGDEVANRATSALTQALARGAR
jgi:hypothetical protein